jgi:hypothetical protein
MSDKPQHTKILHIQEIPIIIGLVIILIGFQYITHLIRVKEYATYSSTGIAGMLWVLITLSVAGIFAVQSFSQVWNKKKGIVLPLFGILGSLLYAFTVLANTPLCPVDVRPAEFPYFTIVFISKISHQLFELSFGHNNFVIPTIIITSPTGNCFTVINLLYPLFGIIFLTIWSWKTYSFKP